MFGDINETDTAVDQLDVKDDETKLYSDGEAKFNVEVDGQALTRARACSKNVVKFALNILELVVTPEECKNNLTLCGEAKGKNALDERKRKSLRSEVFSFMKQDPTEKKERIWSETLIPKLNNKIRAIRNNKYKIGGD